MGHPTIYPSGVTIYNPEKCWSGFTIFQAQELGAVLMDMNGREVNVWKGVLGMPNKLFPGGTLLTSRGRRSGKYSVQDGLDLVQVDWDGNVTWSFDQVEYIEDPGEEPRWMARYHHDFQREGNPVGYYAPGMEPRIDGGNTLVLAHRNVRNPKISDKQLLDDLIVETTWDGDIVWEWLASDHFDEMGFREASKNAMCRNPNYRPTQPEGMGDWLHINSMSYLGPNKWYDAGDERFHPDNLIVDGREANIIFIIEKKTGKIVWKLGPDYDNSPEARAIGWIIGQHHAHMIPREHPHLRQRRLGRLRQPQPRLAHGREGRPARLLPRAGNRPREHEDRLAVHAEGGRLPGTHGQQPLLQPLHQRHAASAQRQYPHHGRLQRPPDRGDPRS